MKSDLKIGFIGCGGMASALADGIAKASAAKMTSFYDVAPESSAKIAAQYGGKSVPSIDALLADDQIDAVVLATPPDLHEEQVVAAAKAGKHVFVEKPMALSVKSCDQMIEAARQSKRTLMVGQVLRYYEPFNSIIRWTREGRFGRPFHAFIQRVSASGGWEGSWRASVKRCGGFLFEFSVHELDFMRCVMGAPTQVFAARQKARPSESEIEDVISLLIRFKSGVSGHYDGGISWGRGKYQFNLCFEKANLISDWAFDPKVLTAISATPKEGEILLSGFETEPPITRQMRGWVEALGEGKPVPIPGEEGRENVRLAEAAYRSAETGQAVAIGTQVQPQRHKD